MRETFKFSTDPFFTEEVRDVVGRYMAPPDRALVLCIDEKSQIPALDRTQPTQPLLIGRAEKGTRDYVRHGTTSLFGALDVGTGAVLGKCDRRHRHQALVAFRDHIDGIRVREPGTTIHVVMDNYGTHKHPVVKEWFARHPEYVPHVTPTRPSWLNHVERVFAQITERRIRRGAFKSAEDLEEAIEDYLPPTTQTHGRSSGPRMPTSSSARFRNSASGSRHHKQLETDF